MTEQQAAELIDLAAALYSVGHLLLWWVVTWFGFCWGVLTWWILRRSFLRESHDWRV